MLLNLTTYTMKVRCFFISKITFNEVKKELNIDKDEPIFYNFGFYYDDSELNGFAKNMLINQYYKIASEIVESLEFKDSKEVIKLNSPDSFHKNPKDLNIYIINVPKMSIIYSLEDYYNEKLNKYFLTIEDIAKFLNVSRIFVQTNIVKHLDEMRFICSRDTEDPILKDNYLKTKALVKEINYSKRTVRDKDFKFLIERCEELNIPSADAPKIILLYSNTNAELFRKKSLYSLDSFLIFLKSSTKELYKNKVFELTLSKDEYDVLISKHKSILLNEYIEKLCSRISSKVKKTIQFKESKLDIELVANEYFIYTNSIERAMCKYYSTIKLFSTASLKIFWDYFYEKQVAEVLKSMDHTKIEFKVKDDNIKASTRYIVNKSDVISIINSNRNKNEKTDKSFITLKLAFESKVLEYLIKTEDNISKYLFNELLKLDEIIQKKHGL